MSEATGNVRNPESNGWAEKLWKKIQEEAEVSKNLMVDPEIEWWRKGGCAAATIALGVVANKYGGEVIPDEMPVVGKVDNALILLGVLYLGVKSIQWVAPHEALERARAKAEMGTKTAAESKSKPISKDEDPGFSVK